jgi:hypothetical protein
MIVGMNEKLESMMLGYQNKDDAVAFGDVMNCVVDSVAAGDMWYVPGFGRYDKTNIGGTFNLSIGI